MDQLSTQLTLSAIASWGIERLKLSPWFPIISQKTDTFNRIVGVLSSGLTSLGVTFTNNATWQSGGTFVITVPDGNAILIAGWHWLQAFVLQQIVYHGVVKKLAPRTVKVETVNVDTVKIENVPVVTGKA